jgi:cytochrome c-type biogenesis protein CcmH/NrfG
MNGYTDQIDQVDRDLAEVAAQLDAGELDAATAARLRDAYHQERAELVASSAAGDRPGRSPQRTLAGAAILGAGVIVIATLAVLSLQTETPQEQASDGVATDVLSDGSGVGLASVTNEEMEAVVAANPTIVGMRLALAERYVQGGEHSRALDHYLTVLDQDPEQPEALAMVGWLTFLAGEPELAEPFVDKALAIEPDYPSAWWFLANIRRANGNTGGAADAIERLLGYDLAAEVRASAEGFLAEVSR